ncbi:S4 domain-containing protein, partial [Roseomonas sp. DSM 102946]|nr:S4 domain-containing protein [Roseomonas sp. DSM 102946]
MSARNQTPDLSLDFIATPEQAGQRLDRVLAEVSGALSRSRVKALIEAGEALRDGQPVANPSEAVRPGARYILHVPPPEPATPQAQAIPLTILYEDPHLI